MHYMTEYTNKGQLIIASNTKKKTKSKCYGTACLVGVGRGVGVRVGDC